MIAQLMSKITQKRQACTDPDLLRQSVPVESARQFWSVVENVTVQLFHIVRRIHHVAFGINSIHHASFSIISACFPSPPRSLLVTRFQPLAVSSSGNPHKSSSILTFESIIGKAVSFMRTVHDDFVDGLCAVSEVLFEDPSKPDTIQNRFVVSNDTSMTAT